jgi:hypothetical protein
MQRDDYFIILFSIIVLTSVSYLFLNLGSFECYMMSLSNNQLGDIKYEFEPQGSLYGKTKIYRFDITSTSKTLEYFGMNVTLTNETIFSEMQNSPAGGSIVATVMINESDAVVVDRFFKKKCYPEMRL